MSLSGSLAIFLIKSAKLVSSVVILLANVANSGNIFVAFKFANFPCEALFFKASSMVSKCELLSWGTLVSLFNK